MIKDRWQDRYYTTAQLAEALGIDRAAVDETITSRPDLYPSERGPIGLEVTGATAEKVRVEIMQAQARPRRDDDSARIGTPMIRGRDGQFVRAIERPGTAAAEWAETEAFQ